ncbi:MAG: MATE family efflux transporter [Zhenhengia sp.]|jgi:putative MATE family efflux protein|uniref:MATE family efflux transporter n=1 Tax=Zhenhengia sp. TaxID=2944208 RepID=UPI002914A88A|nr:MATE family efflux transporter [Clostridiales bacterium]MDU6973258.1 MATE family efflux transporter [Clostridiales bacterium]
MLVTRDKQFYKLLLSIALPIAMQNLITFAVSMVDTLMLGTLGEVELSAASISNNLFFVFMILNFGLAGGSNILISQYWGKNDVKAIHKVLAIMYKVCIALSIVFTAIALFAPRLFISIFTPDMAVVDAGEKYLCIVGLGYFFYAITNCSIMMLRSVKTVKISMVVYSISLLVNAFFNWILIFGNLGAPRLGIEGAAIATVLARFVEFAIVMCFMAFFEKKIKFRLSYFKIKDALMKKDYIKTCTPVVFNEFLWAMGSSMVAVIVGRLGTEVVAANSISNVVNQFVTVFIFGLSSAAAVMIGNSIGEGNYKKTKEYAATIAICVACLAVFAGLLTFTLRPFIVQFYNVSDLTKSIAMDIMAVNSVIVFFQAMANTTNIGILRGGGDVKFVLVNDVIFMWLVAIPLGFIAAFVWSWPVIAVFCVIRVDEILKVICSTRRIISWKWITNVTRDEEYAA